MGRTSFYKTGRGGRNEHPARKVFRAAGSEAGEAAREVRGGDEGCHGRSDREIEGEHVRWQRRTGKGNKPKVDHQHPVDNDDDSRANGEGGADWAKRAENAKYTVEKENRIIVLYYVYTYIHISVYLYILG